VLLAAPTGVTLALSTTIAVPVDAVLVEGQSVLVVEVAPATMSVYTQIRYQVWVA
jgi:hypothetical protein